MKIPALARLGYWLVRLPWLRATDLQALLTSRGISSVQRDLLQLQHEGAVTSVNLGGTVATLPKKSPFYALTEAGLDSVLRRWPLADFEQPEGTPQGLLDQIDQWVPAQQVVTALAHVWGAPFRFTRLPRLGPLTCSLRFWGGRGRGAVLWLHPFLALEALATDLAVLPTHEPLLILTPTTTHARHLQAILTRTSPSGTVLVTTWQSSLNPVSWGWWDARTRSEVALDRILASPIVAPWSPARPSLGGDAYERVHLRGRDRDILDTLTTTPRLTVPLLARLLGVSDATIARGIRSLVAMHLVTPCPDGASNAMVRWRVSSAGGDLLCRRFGLEPQDSRIIEAVRESRQARHEHHVHEVSTAFLAAARANGQDLPLLWMHRVRLVLGPYHLRPDACGVYTTRQGDIRWLLEVDEGGMDQQDWRGKIDRYQRLLTATPFPCVLFIVTTTPTHVTALLPLVACLPCPVYLGTLETLRVSGPLAPIWRTPASRDTTVCVAPYFVLEDAAV